MEFTTKAGIISFLLALSTFNVLETNAKTIQAEKIKNSPTIESRLAAISKAIREKEAQLEETSSNSDISPPLNSRQYAWGNWRDSGRTGQWGNTQRWSNLRGPEGSFNNFRIAPFRNFRNWRNGWKDTPKFVNYRYY